MSNNDKSWHITRRKRTIKAATRRVDELALSMKKVSRMRERKNYEFLEGEKIKMANAIRDVVERELSVFLDGNIEHKSFSLIDDEESL